MISLGFGRRQPAAPHADLSEMLRGASFEVMPRTLTKLDSIPGTVHSRR